VTVEALGLTLSLVLWRRFRRPMPGLLEETYALNRGLADAGPRLPLGAVILIPVRDEAASEQPIVRLWD
jgi:phage tail protein X